MDRSSWHESKQWNEKGRWYLLEEQTDAFERLKLQRERSGLGVMRREHADMRGTEVGMIPLRRPEARLTR